MEDVRKMINEAWDARTIRVDWLGLESALRAVLAESKGEKSIYLDLIDEALAAYTGRGNVRDAHRTDNR